MLVWMTSLNEILKAHSLWHIDATDLKCLKVSLQQATTCFNLFLWHGLVKVHLVFKCNIYKIKMSTMNNAYLAVYLVNDLISWIRLTENGCNTEDVFTCSSFFNFFFSHSFLVHSLITVWPWLIMDRSCFCGLLKKTAPVCVLQSD